MKKTLLALVCATAVLVSGSLFADMSTTEGTTPYKEQQQKLKSLSKEDKKAIFKDAKDKWEKLSASDKQAFKEKVKDFAEKRKTRLEKKCEKLKENTGTQTEMKARLEKKCAKFEQTQGENIYVKLYALDLMKEGKAAK